MRVARPIGGRGDRPQPLRRDASDLAGSGWSGVAMVVCRLRCEFIGLSVKLNGLVVQDVPGNFFCGRLRKKQ